MATPRDESRIKPVDPARIARERTERALRRSRDVRTGKVSDSRSRRDDFYVTPRSQGTRTTNYGALRSLGLPAASRETEIADEQAASRSDELHAASQPGGARPVSRSRGSRPVSQPRGVRSALHARKPVPETRDRRAGTVAEAPVTRYPGSPASLVGEPERRAQDEAKNWRQKRRRLHQAQKRAEALARFGRTRREDDGSVTRSKTRLGAKHGAQNAHTPSHNAEPAAPIQREEPVTVESLAADLAKQAARKAGASDIASDQIADSLPVRHFHPPRHVHIGLLILTMILLSFGLIMLFSASMTGGYADENSATYYVLRQSVFTLIGILAVAALCRIDPNHLNHTLFAWVLFGITTFFLIIVLIPGVGIEVNGQRRWLPMVIIPGMQFQPSEIAKLATVYCGSIYFSRLRRLRSQGKIAARTPSRQVWKDFACDFVIPFLGVGFWCFLISRQSHMSSVLIILITLFVVFLAAGIRPKSWVLMGLFLAVIIVASALFFVAFRSQIEAAMASNPRFAHLIIRFNVFSGKDTNTVGADYQSHQALIGIGSGGFFGVGLGLGRQKFNWLPEIHNDYVYSNICEELGFIGGSLVIILFLIFFIMGISVTLKMQSIYMQVIAAGFSTLIALQAFLSIAVNLMVIPPTGISMPLFSYGGTSNLFFLIGIGFLLSSSKYGVRETEPSVDLASKSPGKGETRV